MNNRRTELENKVKQFIRENNLLDDVKKAYPDKTVLLVCHGGVSRMIKTYFENMTNDEFFHYSPENAFVAEYEM